MDFTWAFCLIDKMFYESIKDLTRNKKYAMISTQNFSLILQKDDGIIHRVILSICRVGFFYCLPEN